MDQAEILLNLARTHEVLLATTESCTGGLVAAALTEIPGSSDVFVQGLVTYHNNAKINLLDVPEVTLARYGAVSREVAECMAEGALARLAQAADRKNRLLTVAVTGIAGPGGGTDKKPVGTVHIATAFAYPMVVTHKEFHFSGNRQQIRQQSVDAALEMMIGTLKNIV